MSSQGQEAAGPVPHDNVHAAAEKAYAEGEPKQPLVGDPVFVAGEHSEVVTDRSGGCRPKGKSVTQCPVVHVELPSIRFRWELFPSASMIMGRGTGAEEKQHEIQKERDLMVENLIVVPTDGERKSLLRVGNWPQQGVQISLCGFGPVAAAACTLASRSRDQHAIPPM